MDDKRKYVLFLWWKVASGKIISILIENEYCSKLIIMDIIIRKIFLVLTYYKYRYKYSILVLKPNKLIITLMLSDSNKINISRRIIIILFIIIYRNTYLFYYVLMYITYNMVVTKRVLNL